MSAPTASVPAFLGPDGELLPGAPTPDPDLALRLYRQMLISRRLDDRAFTLSRQGRIGAYPPISGQEAIGCGAALALTPADWVLGTYRDVTTSVAHGLPPVEFFAYWRGLPDGGIAPPGVNTFPAAIPVGSHMLHAVGVAWAARLRGEPALALTLFGDGATSEGDFHEAMNFAAVLRAPAIFVCQNNGYAISVPLTRQTAAESIAAKAVGYGMPGLRIDGNDALAVHAAVARAAERARAGDGPTLIEAVTYRLRPHTGSDDPGRYRSREEEEEALRREPLARMRAYLLAAGVLDGAGDGRLRAEVEALVEEAEVAALARPLPGPEALTAHVYGEPAPNHPAGAPPAGGPRGGAARA